MKLEEIKKWYILNKKLFFASIEITPKCNFKCKHCYCSSKMEEEISFENFKIIVDKLHEEGCLFLNLTGGEIFTHSRFAQLYSYAKNKGFIIDLLTNGSMINEKHVNLFKELPPHNIAITLYGTTPEEYGEFTGNPKNYDNVMMSLEQLKKGNIPFVLRTIAARTISKSIYDGSFERVARKFGTTFKYDPIIFPMTTGNKAPVKESLNPEEIVELEYSTEIRRCAWEEIIGESSEYKWTCQAGICSLAIDHKGVAYVCGLYRERGSSLIQNEMKEVLLLLEKIHEEHKLIVSSGECSGCMHRSYCKWCPAYAYIYTLKTDKKIPFFCQLAKTRKMRFGG